MRNGIYTIYKGHHLPVHTIKDNDEQFLIRWDGESCPYSEFERSQHEKNVYFLTVSANSLTELYKVKTFGIYKAFQFQVFDYSPDPDKVFIGIKNADALNQLRLFGDENWSFTDVDRDLISVMWETRTPVKNKPMPKGVEFEIKLKS